MNQVKIAISSTGQTLEDSVDARFGRCPYFIIVEIKDKKIKKAKQLKIQRWDKGAEQE